ncbi:tripartite tricarboxylate transporter substrate binding protein [Falsiroseomonas sp. CW058]|uniref:tripartite tricarboxylate transporter substrate binding protein n=1 Tax=Falsiroseomonas sp. CW058 TaxID=3388664 RepID=UPI003D31A6B7
MTTNRRAILAAGAAALAAPHAARAQARWPNGPIRLVVPFPPGGSLDTIARLAQPHLSTELGVPVVVENRPGASGALGTQVVARAAPDGQTWGVVFDTHASNPALIQNIGFDTRRDLVPVMLVATSPMVIACNLQRPWRDLRDMIAAARRAPDTVTYGTVGNGSLSHLTMTLMQRRGGFQIVHVPFRGGSAMTTSAMAGQTDMAMASNAGLLGQVNTTLRPLAQTSATRSPALPDVPTVQEQGIAGIDARAFWAVVGPAGVPDEILRRFHGALARAYAQPEVVARATGPMGVDLVVSSPEEFGAFLDRQMETWAQVVRDYDIRAD